MALFYWEFMFLKCFLKYFIEQMINFLHMRWGGIMFQIGFKFFSKGGKDGSYHQVDSGFFRSPFGWVWLKQKRPQHYCWGLEEGSDILSHRLAVPSALMGLTSLFGMERGEPHRYNHLNCRSVIFHYIKLKTYWENK